MKIAIIASVAAGLLVAAPVMASQELAQKKNCLACHAVDKKLVGPAYKDVAARYRGDAGAPARLAAKVRAGGSGNWGDIPMLPHPSDKISDADLAAAIDWILALQ